MTVASVTIQGLRQPRDDAYSGTSLNALALRVKRLESLTLALVDLLEDNGISFDGDGESDSTSGAL